MAPTSGARCSDSRVAVDQSTMLVDLRDPNFARDPYPTYELLRHTAPVVRTRVSRSESAWLVTRYPEVADALRHPDLSNDVRVLGGWRPPFYDLVLPRSFRSLEESLYTSDTRAHLRLSRLARAVLTPSFFNSLSGLVERTSDELLTRVAGRPEIDVVEEIALPLPMIVICELLGLPASERGRFRDWSVRFLGTGSTNPIHLWRGARFAREVTDFLRPLVRERRQGAGTDVISTLARAEVDGDRFSDDEVMSLAFLLLVAGHETTINLIANGILSFLQAPGSMARLRAEPTLIEAAVEEVLRFSNPVAHAFTRFARNEIELGGLRIPARSRVIALLGSANRDESVFPEPTRFVIDREPNRHLSFGLGAHHCLGAPLARLEGRIVLAMFAERFPAARLANPSEPPAWRALPGTRRLMRLPVRLDRG